MLRAFSKMLKERSHLLNDVSFGTFGVLSTDKNKRPSGICRQKCVYLLFLQRKIHTMSPLEIVWFMLLPLQGVVLIW